MGSTELQVQLLRIVFNLRGNLYSLHCKAALKFTQNCILTYFEKKNKIKKKLYLL